MDAIKYLTPEEVADRYRGEISVGNHENPSAVDDRFFRLKESLEDAVKDHSAL